LIGSSTPSARSQPARPNCIFTGLAPTLWTRCAKTILSRWQRRMRR
jgi:hypothetical protein